MTQDLDLSLNVSQGYARDLTSCSLNLRKCSHTVQPVDERRLETIASNARDLKQFTPDCRLLFQPDFDMVPQAGESAIQNLERLPVFADTNFTLSCMC